MANRREELDDDLIPNPDIGGQLILSIGKKWLKRFKDLEKLGKTAGYEIRASAVRDLQRFIERNEQRFAAQENGKNHVD